MTQECLLTLDEVRSTFFAAPPSILKEIKDLTIRVPSFMRDIPNTVPWGTGEGTTKTEMVFRGQMPKIETDFNAWTKLRADQGCDPCTGPGCGYNLTKVGGFGFDQKLIDLMSRELVSEVFCIKDIQTTAHFKEVFAKLVQNLWQQIDFIKEINVNFNYLTQLLKKFVVDSTGVRPNPANPYVYPNIGTARISALNPYILEWFYEWMKRMTDVEPYDVMNGSPVYAVIASSQIFSHMYRDDPALRQDIRFSGYANDLITKYNFVNTIQGMFFPVTWMWPRRFNIVAGEPMQVLPTVNGIPMNYGSYTGINPAYESATHEEVIICGKNPFKLWVMPTETSLGENTSFGPEPSYFDYWKFINPETPLDPLRREGYFISAATIGLSANHSEGMFGILVARPSITAIATFLPGVSCPPVAETCTNEIPAQTDCPCPLILNVVANPITAGDYFVYLSGTTGAVADDDVQFGLDTGGYITGTVVAVNDDLNILEVDFGDTVVPPNCAFISLFCDNTLGCSASVLQYLVSCTDGTQLSLILSNPIKADTASDVVTLYYGDGTTQSATVVSFDMATNTWLVDVGATAFCDQVLGVVSICVPPTTDDTCPACDGGPTITQCT